MPRILNDLHNDKTIAPNDLAGLHVTYMKICVELDVPVTDAATREVVARLVVQLHRRGLNDFMKCLAAARNRLD